MNGTAAKYLLTGMAVCGQCGGALTIRTRAHGTRRLALYQCLTHVTKGPRICANRSAIRQGEAESAVLETVQHQLLHPDNVLPILEAAVHELQGSDAEAKRQRLEADLSRLTMELGRLADVTGGRLFKLPNEAALPGVLDEIVADLRSQYVLGFTPAGSGAPGRMRKISVKVPGRGKVVVRHRVGYRLQH